MMPLELCVLTLNVWGIPYVSKDIDIRMKSIGEELATGKYDIVSLQEVWSEKDYQVIKNATADVLPFAHYFYSGVFGSGLCILSKWPIIAALYHAWPLNGYVHRIQHGDWFGGKGVGLCKINVNGKLVHIYTAHLHAEYDPNCDDYLSHRVIQAFDAAQFIENTRGSSILQILAGDLNTEKGDITYRLLVTTSHLADSYDESSLLEGTNECAKNSYTDFEAAKKYPKGKRIDHILHRPGYKYESKILEYSHPLPIKIPGLQISFSDHEAVLSKFQIRKLNSEELLKKNKNHQLFLPGNSQQIGENYDELTNNMNALQESISVCNESLNHLESHKKSYIVMALGVLTVLFLLIDTSPPYGLKSLFLVLNILLSGLVIFFILMATVWNTIEKHGILSGKISMELALKSIEQIIYNNVENFKT